MEAVVPRHHFKAEIIGFLLIISLFVCGESADGEVYNFRCYTASKPCTKGKRMMRLRECIRYRGRCMERIFPENVTQCCNGYVGKHCDNFVDDEFYFASSVMGIPDIRPNDHLQRTEALTYNRRSLRGPKGEKGDRGPEGFIGMPGQKGDRGSSEKGQKGEPGQMISKSAGGRGEKGQRGKRGPKGKRGPRGRKGDVGPIGPPGKPGQSPNRTDCVCPGLSRRLQELESIVRDLQRRLDIGQAVGLARQPILADDTGDIQTVTMGDAYTKETETYTSVTTDDESRIEDYSTNVRVSVHSTGSPTTPGSTEQSSWSSELTKTPALTTSPTPESTAAFTTTTEGIHVQCNSSNTTKLIVCTSENICNISVSAFTMVPPPPLLPSLKNLWNSTQNNILYYLNALSCCSNDTLEHARQYYESYYLSS